MNLKQGRRKEREAVRANRVLRVARSGEVSVGTTHVTIVPMPPTTAKLQRGSAKGRPVSPSVKSDISATQSQLPHLPPSQQY